jgi:hypothetical protein
MKLQNTINKYFMENITQDLEFIDMPKVAMPELTINPRFRDLLPALTPDELDLLEKNLMEDGGAFSPILTWEGTIIDGHNRYTICKKHNLSFKIEKLELKSEDDVIEYIILHQEGQRNLNDAQRIALALHLEPIWAARALANKAAAATASNKHRENPDMVILPTPEIKPVVVRDEIAKVAKVSPRQVDKFKAIQKVATPEIKEQLTEGEISVSKAYGLISAIAGGAKKIFSQQAKDKRTEAKRQKSIDASIEHKKFLMDWFDKDADEETKSILKTLTSHIATLAPEDQEIQWEAVTHWVEVQENDVPQEEKNEQEERTRKIKERLAPLMPLFAPSNK